MVAWSLSGVDAERWFVAKASVWRPPVSVRATSIEIPGKHGAIEPGLPQFEAPTVNLVLEPMRATLVDLEAAVNELLALLSAPGLTLTRASGGVTASAPARLQSVTHDGFEDATPLARVEVALTIPGVFLRGPLTSSPATVVASGAVVAISTLAGSTAPVADAVLRLAGPLTTVQVIDAVTGTGLSWAGSLPAGQHLYLDAGSLRAWTSASASQWTPGGVDVTAAVDYPGAGVLQLWPRMQGSDPADRQAKVTVTGAGFSAATSLMVRAAPAYL